MAETRKAFVQQLRWLGRECGVPLVRDDARREKVVDAKDVAKNYFFSLHKTCRLVKARCEAATPM